MKKKAGKKISKDSKQTLKIVLGVLVVLIILFAINSYLGKDVRLQPTESDECTCGVDECDCDKPNPGTEYTCEKQEREFDNGKCSQVSEKKSYWEYRCYSGKPVNVCSKLKDQFTCPPYEKCYLVAAGGILDCRCQRSFGGCEEGETKVGHPQCKMPNSLFNGYTCCPKDPNVPIPPA